MGLPAPGPGRTAVVTGASSGIGYELAREFAARGHHVTLVARRADRLEELAADISRSGGQAAVIAMDLSNRAARADLPNRVAALGLTTDILVNNAGLSTLGPVAAADPAGEMHMIEVDVIAVADLCTRFLPGMVERGRGAVLNVASTGAFQPLPGQAGYGACKAFVLSYTQGLCGELSGTGVTATVLCPGPVDTGFGEAAGISKQDAQSALPAFLWISPQTVARTAVDALAKGHIVVIPGLANRLAAVLGRLTPNRLLVPLLAKGHPGLRS
ncbi:SDR family NAD(P)-dependent oxidoreductase [Mycobacterium talmoniae]|uniref:NADP-dependent 3-hydroxy acid dehydrogenase YdfG n=1 Tax=Mycobacterium talmoniae TaxID=1858794 RepID=A0A1S1NKH4_9MYCO|nr:MULTISPECIES: SDR family oxidoreductase [Mycobacterium]OHV04988.1 oxidoreductase [Mycobacterium talmoniae]PQM48348.1 NADP-dependent 3-hydroxy acid dehydrogenase YdfG [Mycobacterium talmoniae]TDH53124.1 SDR family oxidoreductase [Mycobacterium eburneum]